MWECVCCDWEGVPDYEDCGGPMCPECRCGCIYNMEKDEELYESDVQYLDKEK